MNALIAAVKRAVGYKVLAGFGDVADFEYYVWTAQGAEELFRLHPASCFVQVFNRYGREVAYRA